MFWYHATSQNTISPTPETPNIPFPKPTFSLCFRLHIVNDGCSLLCCQRGQRVIVRNGPMESREGTLLRLGLRVLGVPPSLLKELLVVQLLLYLLSPIAHPEALDPRIIARPGANRIFLALHRRKCRRVHGRRNRGGLDTRSASWNVSRSWDAEWQTSRTYRSWQFAIKTKSAQSGQSLKLERSPARPIFEALENGSTYNIILYIHIYIYTYIHIFIYLNLSIHWFTLFD